MASEGRKRAIARIFDRIFIDRELFLRANDRVAYLRIRKWMQIAACVCLLPVFGWVVFASFSVYILGDVVAERDQEIAQQKVDYFDLLAEVGEYHQQYAKITGDLEANQDYLLSLLTQDSTDARSIEVIQERLRESVTERDRVVLAREGLQNRLQAFEANLQKIANKNVSLQAEVAEMSSALQNTEAERAQVAAARERLGIKLRQVESELAQTKGNRAALEQTVAALRGDLAEAEARQHELAEAEQSYRQRVAEQERELKVVGEARDQAESALEQTAAALRGDLAEAEARQRKLAAAEQTFKQRVAEQDRELKSAREALDQAQSELAGLRPELARSNQHQAALAAAESDLEQRVARQEQELGASLLARERLQAGLIAARSVLHRATERHWSLASAEHGLRQRVAELESQTLAAEQARSQLELSFSDLRQKAAVEQAANELEKKRLQDEQTSLRHRLSQAETEEQELRRELADLTGSLKATNVVAQDARSERDRVVARLQEVEPQLAALAEAKSRSAATIGQLRTSLDTAVAQSEVLRVKRELFEAQAAGLAAQLEEADGHRRALEQQVAELRETKSSAAARNEELESRKNALESHVAELRENLEQATAQRDSRDTEVAGLTAALEEAQGDGDDLKTEKMRLVERVASLERELSQMRNAQETIVKRLSERTLLSVDTMEKTISLTGIDLRELLAQVLVEPSILGRGGPFIPGEFIGDGTKPAGLQSSVALLDLHIDRWEALQEIVRTLPLVAPLDQYRLSSGFGYRKDPLNGRKGVHEGLDFSAPSRTPIYATSSGKVIFAGWRGRYGRMVEVDHGLGIKTRYAHMKKILVKPGQEIGHRDKIGLVGSSGRSTGPHVHYEVLVNDKPVDPMNFLKAGNHVFKS